MNGGNGNLQICRDPNSRGWGSKVSVSVSVSLDSRLIENRACTDYRRFALDRSVQHASAMIDGLGWCVRGGAFTVVRSGVFTLHAKDDDN